MPIPGIFASQISGHLFAPSGAYDSLANTAITTGTASLTWSGIPAGYKHLQIRYYARFNLTSDTGSPSFQFNGDTGANYSFHQIYGDGAGNTGATGNASQTRLSAAQIASDNVAANYFGAGYINILDYGSTVKNKTMDSFGGWTVVTNSLINYRSGVWLSTAPITSITIFPTASGNWLQYSNFALYGVK